MGLSFNFLSDEAETLTLTRLAHIGDQSSGSGQIEKRERSR
jgi:hypothetical protein